MPKIKKQLKKGMFLISRGGRFFVEETDQLEDVVGIVFDPVKRLAVSYRPEMKDVSFIEAMKVETLIEYKKLLGIDDFLSLIKEATDYNQVLHVRLNCEGVLFRNRPGSFTPNVRLSALDYKGGVVFKTLPKETARGSAFYVYDLNKINPKL